jgi:dehydrogenase/reductase SDR family protein 7B
MKFADQTVWITGASSGVGEGLARVFNRHGANIIISARRQEELERVKAACIEGPGRVDVVPFDIVDEAQRQAAAEQVLAANKRIDVLINNAGGLLCAGRAHEVSVASHDGAGQWAYGCNLIGGR